MAMQAAEALISQLRSRWTRTRFDRVVALGGFEGERVELVRGELVEMVPQGVDHPTVIEALNEVLMVALVRRARVRIQCPIVIDDDTELEPDVAIVDRRASKKEHPSTAHLVIEVAESSARYDRLIKAPLYAKAGVAEYWLVDLAKQHVEVFAVLRAGRYSKQSRHSKGALSVPGFQDVTVDIAKLFS